MNQTEITATIQTIADGFSDTGIGRIFEVLEWTHKNCKSENDPVYKQEHFRTRTAEKIIESKKCTGCTDFALVFIALMRASGYESTYVEAVEEKWLQEGGDNISGHIFVEVIIDGKTYIIDPQGACIKAWYGKRYIVFAKGKDSWDIGIKNFYDLKEKFKSFREQWLIKNNL